MVDLATEAQQQEDRVKEAEGGNSTTDEPKAVVVEEAVATDVPVDVPMKPTIEIGESTPFQPFRSRFLLKKSVPSFSRQK